MKLMHLTHDEELELLHLKGRYCFPVGPPLDALYERLDLGACSLTKGCGHPFEHRRDV